MQNWLFNACAKSILNNVISKEIAIQLIVIWIHSDLIFTQHEPTINYHQYFSSITRFQKDSVNLQRRIKDKISKHWSSFQKLSILSRVQNVTQTRTVGLDNIFIFYSNIGVNLMKHWAERCKIFSHHSINGAMLP